MFDDTFYRLHSTNITVVYVVPNYLVKYLSFVKSTDIFESQLEYYEMRVREFNFFYKYYTQRKCGRKGIVYEQSDITLTN